MRSTQNHLQPVLPVISVVHCKPRFFKSLHDKRSDFSVVFDDKNPHFIDPQAEAPSLREDDLKTPFVPMAVIILVQ